MRATLVALTLALSTFSAACDKGTKEADQKAAEAAKTAKDAEDKANAAKLKADEEKAKAAAAHAEARNKLQKDMDAHDRKGTYLREKAAKATGAAKANADAAVKELDARRDAAKASVAKLSDDASPTWDGLRKTAEDDIAAVGKAVDTLETTVNKK